MTFGASAGDAPASFNLLGAFTSIIGAAASVTYKFPVLSAGLWTTSELMSLIPSGTPDVSQTLNESYNDLRSDWASAIGQASKALEVESQEVRSDQSLLMTAGELLTKGTWVVDPTGMESIGDEGFAEWVYKTLLPKVWERYVIDGCGTDVMVPCTAPPAGPWLIGGPQSFTAIGPNHASRPPCTEHGNGRAPSSVNCAFLARDATLAGKVWGKLSPSCD